MDTEAKARAYDEAYKIAESIHRFSSNIAEIKRMEEIFPELKESEDKKIKKEIISHLKYLGKYCQESMPNVNEWITWIEKQGEQNVANKVEPKFHEGDWVIDKQGIVHQIANVVENVTNHTYGYDIVGGGYFNDNNESVRLWAIQDAKDGDVLVNGSNIFIFHFINDTRLMGYCHVNTDDGRFYDDIGRNECFCLIDAVVNPATKEQREHLEKAMADAGYTFDFNKKELKKIEQKLSENVKPQSSTPMSYGKELEERMYEACNRFNAPNTDPNRYSAADLFYAGVKAERDLNTHAWSEEYERILVEMLKIFNIENFEGYNIGEYNEDALKFLKSLKGRVQPQPKQECGQLPLN